MRKSLSAILILFLTSQLAACGTILYPERRGQAAGRIDPGVAVLDGVGLLFFIVPGVVAFGVDFATGAIYLPQGHAAMETIPLHPAQPGHKVSRAEIARAIRQHTGKKVDFSSTRMLAFRMPDKASLTAAVESGTPGPGAVIHSRPQGNQSTSATMIGM